MRKPTPIVLPLVDAVLDHRERTVREIFEEIGVGTLTTARMSLDLLVETGVAKKRLVPVPPGARGGYHNLYARVA